MKGKKSGQEKMQRDTFVDTFHAMKKQLRELRTHLRVFNDAEEHMRSLASIEWEMLVLEERLRTSLTVQFESPISSPPAELRGGEVSTDSLERDPQLIAPYTTAPAGEDHVESVEL